MMILSKTLCLTAVLCLGCASLSLASANLLENGDIERGTSGWEGDQRISEIENNKVIEIELDENETLTFEQTFKTEKIEKIILKFRTMTSDDYSGMGLKLTFSGKDESYNYSFKNMASKDWQGWKVGHQNFDKDSKLTLKIQVYPGQGSIFFDDFLMTKTN